MMNIALFTFEYPPRIMGGLGTYTSELSKQLVKMEQNISVFTMNDGTLKTRELMNGIEVHRPKLIDITNALPEDITDEMKRSGPGVRPLSDVMLYNFLVSTKIVNDLIPNEMKQFDILSVHDWLSSMSGIVLKQSTNIPMVFHLHSTEKGRSLGDGSKIINELEHKAAQVADKIITVSYAMKSELISYGFSSDKIEVVWNGVNPNKYSPQKIPQQVIEKLRSSYGIKPTEKMILFIGRLTGVKGVDRLIMSMQSIIKSFPNTKLVVVGKGELESNLTSLTSSLGLNNNVIFNFNMLPEYERIAHYAACDLAVFPSFYEPFGIVALEAMAMEKPIIVGARGVSGLREIVVASGQEMTGYHINPYDPQDIAWGVNSALGDEDHMKVLGRNGRKRVLEQFTWEKTASDVLKIYEKVAFK
jgi:glycosyltransferase involved in cell wall biosynthesis